LHTRFHDDLIAAFDSKRWLRLRDQLYLQAERYPRMLLPYARVERDVDAEHKVILGATLERDANRACIALAEHLQKTADILLASATAPFDDGPRRSEQAQRAGLKA
jgi:GntR family transcriptional regulator, carbon starvation induced regulator